MRKLTYILLFSLLFFGCPKPPQNDSIMVSVCAESKLLPNDYCPDVVVMKFKQGTEPTTTCTLHKKPIKVCPYPWPENGKLLCWSGTFFAGLFMDLDEEKLEKLYDEMAPYVNSTRDFLWCAYLGGEWGPVTKFPWLKNETGKWDLSRYNEDFWQQVDRRLQMLYDRKLTTIISLVDFCSINNDGWDTNPFNGSLNVNGTHSDHRYFIIDDHTICLFELFVRETVKRTKKFLPYIIYECGNEPDGDYDWLHLWYQRVILALKSEDVPVGNIQIGWFDSSYFYNLLTVDLERKGLASWHCFGSPRSLDDFFTSPGMTMLKEAGTYPSNDGADWYGEAEGWKGLVWPEAYRRPSLNQLKSMMDRIKADPKCRGYEHLSAGCVINGELPNLDDALTYGCQEWEVMRHF